MKQYLEKVVNSELSVIQQLVELMSAGNSIESVIADQVDGDIVGYTVVFESGWSVYLSIDGNADDDGVGIVQYEGVYYWTLGGEFVLDSNGDRMPVVESTPFVRVEDDVWQVSFDGGMTWAGTTVPKDESPICGIVSVEQDGMLYKVKFMDGQELLFTAETINKVLFCFESEELQGWDEAMFIEDGTWALSKKQGEGVLFALGTMDENEKGAIAYFDDQMHPLEIYHDRYIVRFYNYSEDSADVAVIEGGNVLDCFSVDLTELQPRQSLATKNEALTNTCNIIGGILSMVDYATLISNGRKYADVFGAGGFIYNKATWTINTIGAVYKCSTGQDLIKNPIVSGLMDLGGLGLDLAQCIMFGSTGIVGAVISVIGVYSNLYDTYKDLYNSAVTDIYGNCTAEIEKIDVDGNSTEISVSVTGFEAFGITYNCGVAVDDSVFAPDANEKSQRKSVDGNGIYKFNQNGLEYGKEYNARPFIESTDGISLWKSFIGDWVGPLIRYGKETFFRIDKPSASTGDCLSVADKSAVVECSYSNTNSGTFCGVEVSWEGGENRIPGSNQDGSQEISISGLKPATSYSYRAFVEYGNEISYGESKTFTTSPPDISGTWSCTETHYNRDGSPRYDTYSITLHKDGTVSYSEANENLNSSWGLSKTGELVISIMDMATLNYNSGKIWKGKVDDMSNPSRATGSTYTWHYNSVVGTVNNDSYEFLMTR